MRKLYKTKLPTAASERDLRKAMERILEQQSELDVLRPPTDDSPPLKYDVSKRSGVKTRSNEPEAVCA